MYFVCVFYKDLCTECHVLLTGINGTFHIHCQIWVKYGKKDLHTINFS